jgi:hypothetical protein
MMVRREGEISSTAIDREYSHQVILPAHCYTGTDYGTVHAFCIGLSLAPRGYAVIKNDEWHHVFCFAVREDAEKLMARFGGEWFSPQTRGRNALAAARGRWKAVLLGDRFNMAKPTSESAFTHHSAQPLLERSERVSEGRAGYHHQPGKWPTQLQD